MHRFLRSLASAACIGTLTLVCGGAGAAGLARAQAKPLEVIARFDPAVCQGPSSPLVEGSDGHFYGTLSTGGANFGGCLYRVTSAGQLTILHEFSYAPGQGAVPYGGLQRHPEGGLLGSTLSGGPGASGTVFRASLAGEISYLHRFGEDPLGYIGPSGAPVRAADGRLYGLVAGSHPANGGAIYSIAPDGGDLRIHHAFGRRPGEVYGGAGMLTAGQDGALYGALVFGPNDSAGAGGIFRMALDGSYQLLHTMQAEGDGVNPQGGVIQLADGSLYGTNTSFGGDGQWGSRGTIFRLSQRQLGQGLTRFKLLFTGSEFSGPNTFAAGLTPTPDGSLWTQSTFGGARDQGMVVRLSRRGQLTQVHTFDGSTGSYPHWALTLGSDGWLYGVTQQGGRLGGGVVFRVRP